jgi:uncharacterized low-complexity protein
MRVGSLERVQPISLGVKPWRVDRVVVRARVSKAHEGSAGEGRCTPARETALEGTKPKRATRRSPV